MTADTLKATARALAADLAPRLEALIEASLRRLVNERLGLAEPSSDEARAESAARARGPRTSNPRRRASSRPGAPVVEIDAVVSALRGHPGGLRSEQLQRALSIPAKDKRRFHRVLMTAVAKKRITFRGQKRARHYFAKK